MPVLSNSTSNIILNCVITLFKIVSNFVETLREEFSSFADFMCNVERNKMHNKLKIKLYK